MNDCACVNDDVIRLSDEDLNHGRSIPCILRTESFIARCCRHLQSMCVCGCVDMTCLRSHIVNKCELRGHAKVQYMLTANICIVFLVIYFIFSSPIL